MNKDHEPNWLNWAKRIQSLAQQGLSYTKDKYELDRYQQLRDLSVEIMNEYTDETPEKIKDLFCFERGYQTPKNDVRGAILVEDDILLVHEKIDNKWAMPGGWCDIGLSIRENIKKECLEEAGAVVNPTKLVCVLDWVSNTKAPLPYAIYKTVMLCNFDGYKFQDNTETMEAEFFNRYDLPELSEGRTNEFLINLCFEARDNPEYIPIID